MKSEAKRNRCHCLPLFGISKLWQRYMGTSTGWHQSAKINCVLLVALSAFLLCALIYAGTRPGGILHIMYIYDGPCDGYTIPFLNLFLHLLINIVSTLVVRVYFLIGYIKLASSNFFMQVLNAPSREEVDAAHKKGTWMEIGVSSIRNISKVSNFKRGCWLGLAITSIPIHLFFNSVIFSTGYRGTAYTTTIASEKFLDGGSFYLPGASLLVGATIDGYGYMHSLDDYTASGSEVAAAISSAARNGSSWDKLSFSDCKIQFGVYGTECSGVTRYSDLLLIIDKADGWVRSDMWHLTENQSHFWDSYVPADEPNHLFFHTECSMDSQNPGCCNDCVFALGGKSGGDTCGSTVAQWPSGFPFFTNDHLYLINSDFHHISRPQSGSYNLQIKYCLARRFQPQCHIGISRTLLLSVVIFILCKTSIALLVTWVMRSRRQSSLVTLGDYMASLIETPDLLTFRGPAAAIPNLQGPFFSPGPMQWQGLHPRRIASVPRAVWALSYLLFSIDISICIYLISTTVPSDQTFSGQFLSSDLNPIVGLPIYTFLASVLVVNAPQILLSLSYIAFNNLFTYFCVAIEWDTFSRKYLPLRVTDPQGEQISTYRLQLPYTYSLPLIALSVFLHWLVSNTIYIIVSEGGFLKKDHQDPEFSEDTGVALGYSPISLIVLTVVAGTAVTIPIILGLKRLSSNMIHVGTNSKLIAMVCHASPLLSSNSNNNSHVRLNSLVDELSECLGEVPVRGGFEECHELSELAADTVPLNRSFGCKERGDEGLSPLQKVARSRVRWGVIPTSEDFRRQHNYEILGFGVEVDSIATPIVGKLYM